MKQSVFFWERLVARLPFGGPGAGLRPRKRGRPKSLKEKSRFRPQPLAFAFCCLNLESKIHHQPPPRCDRINPAPTCPPNTFFFFPLDLEHAKPSNGRPAPSSQFFFKHSLSYQQGFYRPTTPTPAGRLARFDSEPFSGIDRT